MKCKRYLKKYICMLLLLTAVFLQAGRVRAVSFSSITSESIREKEGQISEAQDEKNQLSSALTDIKALKGELEKEKANLENYVVALDNNLAEIQKKISELNGMIVEKEEEIRVTEGELEAAIQKNLAALRESEKQAEEDL